MSEETLTVTIPTLLSEPHKVLGPFTRLQLLLLFIGAAIGADIYVDTGWAPHTNLISWLRIGIAIIPLLCSLALTLIRRARRTLGAWLVLLFLFLRRQHDAPWRSVCLQDSFALLVYAEERTLQEEKEKHEGGI